MQIRLVVLGEPKAQARHRHFSKGNFQGEYDPSAKDKQSFLSVIQSQAPKEPIYDPISIGIMFCMARPKNHYRSGKNHEFLKDSAPEYHSGRPDLDNMVKFVTDSLNHIFYRDDSLICELKAKKVYSEKPQTLIVITTI